MSASRTGIIVQALAVSLVLLMSGRATAIDVHESWIEHIKGSVYYVHSRTDNSVNNSIFMVTDEGIILVDPVHANTANWLKEELKELFDQPVRYIVYSHFHWDHAPGAEVFSDTVIDIVAQENAVKNINNDRNIDKAKVLPTRTYRARMELSLGGKTIELLDITSGHTDDTTIVRFPDEGIVFSVDVAPAGRVAWRYFGGFNVKGSNDIDLTLTDMETIMALDFDIIAPGHDDYKTREDLRRTYEYHIDLCKRVSIEIEAGSDLPQVLEKVTMSDYSDLGAYDKFVAMNVEGMHYQLTRNASKYRHCGTWLYQ